MESQYGTCKYCGNDLTPVWFIEEEIVYSSKGGQYYTGRKRYAVDYLVCECCGNKEVVDDTFDGAWQRPGAL